MGTHVIDGSRRMLDRADALFVRGCNGHKRSHQMLERGYPVFVRRAEGAHFWDVDGNRYLDYLMGFGPILLGYNDPAVNQAVKRQMEDGMIFSTAHEKEIEVGERILEMIPWAGMLGYFIGGSAATSGAVRLARAYTGREKILWCGYHGWHDWTHPGTPGVPKVVGELSIEFPYGKLEALEQLLKEHEGEVACVIVETVLWDGPPAGYLQGCVDLAHKYGALCIFDEVKMGFRIAMGGASEYYGVVPDLAAYGKACCNGYPGSFVVGKKEILETEACQGAWLAATFHCDLASLVALDVVMTEIVRRDGIAYQFRLGNRMIEGINEACRKAGLSYRLVGLGPMPTPLMEKEDKAECIRMLQGCLARGFYIHPGHAMFLSLAHSEDDIEQTIRAVEQSIADL